MQHGNLIGNLLYEIFVSRNMYSAFWIIFAAGEFWDREIKFAEERGS